LIQKSIEKETGQEVYEIDFNVKFTDCNDQGTLEHHVENVIITLK